MPFLVDSVMGELQARTLCPELVLHPIFKVRRSRTGKFETSGCRRRELGGWHAGKLILILLPALAPSAAHDLAQTLAETLAQVRAAVADWRPMLARLEAASNALAAAPAAHRAGADRGSCRVLPVARSGTLHLSRHAGVPAGGRTDATGALVPIEGTSLVSCASRTSMCSRGKASPWFSPLRSGAISSLPSRSYSRNRASSRRVHRRTLMDYIGLKTYRSDGTHAGELRIVGLFTSQAYTQQAQQIPLLRRKIDAVIAKSGFAPGSHAGKALLNVLDTFPRDELFRIGERTLQTWVQGILELELRPRLRVFVRPDRFDRFVSALVYIQRDRYSTAMRERMSVILAEAFNGHVTAFTPFFTDGPLVRVHFIIERNVGARPEVHEKDLEQRINAATRTWGEQLADALSKAGSEMSRWPASMSKPSRQITRISLRPLARWRTSRVSSGLALSTRSASTSTERSEHPPPSYAQSSIASTRRSHYRIECRCWRTSASRSSTSAVIASCPVSTENRGRSHCMT